ncbi:MAG: hydantoinase B/oxoprolinase family protein [Alphaproteobacteria bacterium]|nr:hydantoinase B/oxoprolinase family protein [Alphaproteobacteria bacterium]
MARKNRTLDAVSLGIMWDRLIALTDEIVSTLVRTSFSTIVRESYDLSVVVLDAGGHLMAQGTYSVPVFIGTAPRTLKYMLEKFPPHTLRPGDVLVTNDPWMGTGHMFDISVMRPVFRGRKIVAYTMSITHLPDVGGLGFGAAATEIFHEGLRLPICKLVKGGELDPFMVDLIHANCRVPDQVMGDLMANVSCNEVGGRQVLEFMQEYSLDDLSGLSHAIREHSEQAMRQKIREMRRGVYRNRVMVEAIDAPVEYACRVEVDDGEVRIDFTGTGPCVDRGINVPFCYTNAMSLYAIKCLTIPSIPNNGGATLPVKVSAPPGCILNAQPPVPTGGRHIMGHFVPPLIFGALAEAAPDKVQADCGMMDLMTVQGRHTNGRGVSTIYFSAGGFGALQGRDGTDTLPGPSNMAVVPVEIWETLTTLTVESKRLRPDSGGSGAARGGVGQEVVLRNDSGHPMTVFSMANRTEFPALGMAGGKAGAMRQHKINDVAVHPKGKYVLRPGDRITLVEAGGGGYGDPRQRPVAQVVADVREGFVTPEGAARDYGVRVDPATLLATRQAAE